MRSKGASDPKVGQQYVALFTSEVGPDGPPLKRKYIVGVVTKKTRAKSDGNRNAVGRKGRSKMRGHGGGQISAEEKQRRERQSREAHTLWGQLWGRTE